jgi:hypothetical protein
MQILKTVTTIVALMGIPQCVQKQVNHQYTSGEVVVCKLQKLAQHQANIKSNIVDGNSHQLPKKHKLQAQVNQSLTSTTTANTVKGKPYEYVQIDNTLFTSNTNQDYLAQINGRGYTVILPETTVTIEHSLIPNSKNWQINNEKAQNRNTDFTTEYVNDKNGLRQNFILNKPLDHNKTLRVQQTVHSAAKVKVSEKSIDFSCKNKVVLSYSDLKVWDKNKQKLAANFEAVNDTVFNIVVNLEEASFPITIDPINTVPSSVVSPADQNNAYLGTSVSSAGDINGDGYSEIIMGAPSYSVSGNANVGAAFLYYGSASGINTAVLTTITPTTQTGAGVGNAVSNVGDINGDGYGDIAIAASKYDVGTNMDEGAVFIYTGSAIGISTMPYSTVTLAGQAGAAFGTDMAFIGDFQGDGFSDFIIGAAKYDVGANLDEGAVFTAFGNAIGLSFTSAISNVGQAGAEFGGAVAGAGDVNGDGFGDVLVGAPLWNNLGSTDEGIAYVYLGNSSGLFTTPSTSLTHNTIQNQAFFGSALSTAGDVNGDGYSDIIIGSYGSINGVLSNAGKVHIYYGSSAGIASTASLVLTTPNQADAEFGKAVATAGDLNGDGYADVIIAAPGFDTPTVNEGRTYVYYGSSTGLQTTATTIDDANHTNAFFGNSIGSAGDVNGDGFTDILVGCALYNQAFTAEGAAFVYHGAPGSITEANSVILENTTENSSFSGLSVSRAGDVNADGFDDILIGVPLLNEISSADVGSVFLYYGGPSGLPLSPSVTFDEVNSAFARFGESISTAGDINGDGYSDIIIGCPNCDNQNTNEGAAFVYYGSATGINTTATVLDPTNQNDAGFGIAVATAGDVNGDAYSDIIVGAYRFDSPTYIDEGAAYIYYGSPTGINTTPSVVYTSSAKAGALFGNSVSSIGDANADGYSDIAIGAYFYSVTTSSIEGRVYVYYGAQIGLPANPNITLASTNQSGQSFGKSISACGDINGDGIDDFIVGANAYDNNTSFLDAGRAYVYLGSTAGINETNRIDLLAEDEFNGNFGNTVAGLGDINGDGISDIGVGAYVKDFPYTDVGRAYIYKGGTSFSNASKIHQFSRGLHSNSWFAYVAAAAGDINGDGYSDMLISEPSANKAPYNRTGKTHVYYGNNGNNNKRHSIRLYLTDLTTPYNAISGTDQTTFGIGIYARSFEGRSKASIVWETKLNYFPFSGSPSSNSTNFTAQNPTLVDLGTQGAEIKSVVSKQLSLHNFTKIRARVKYSLVHTLTGQVYGPWRYNQENLAGIWMGALPLQIYSLHASWAPLGQSAYIHFKTSNEIAMEKYLLQKSINGIHFTTIDSTVAQNLETAQYQFTDHNTTNQKQWYRIVAIAPNGASKYSNIILLKNQSHTTIQIVPTVVSHLLHIQQAPIHHFWSIVGSSGNTIDFGTTQSTNFNINVAKLPSGSYIFCIGNQRIKFVKL